jgi:hypothetical protein
MTYLNVEATFKNVEAKSRNVEATCRNVEAKCRKVTGGDSIYPGRPMFGKGSHCIEDRCHKGISW